MYKQPPKRVQRIRLIALYSAMTVAVVLVVVALVMVVSNYGYNQVTGTFEQRGLVQLASTPSGATIEVDGETLSSKTSTKSSVEPGIHQFVVWREGYETWFLTTPINRGSLVWLNYIRLIPKNRPVEVLGQYTTVTATSSDPNNEALLVQFDAKKPEFRYVDITRDAPAGRMIQLPKQAYEPANDDEKAAVKRNAPTYSIATWDESGRYVMVWYTIGSSKQLIVLDTEDPTKTVNVSREFSLPVDDARFSGRSGNVLYVTSGGTLRRLNISEGTVSRSLAPDVAQFDVFDSNTVTYVSRPDEETGARTLGVYREGDKEATVLRTVTDREAQVSIVARTYYNTTYTAITEGKHFELYAGHYDRGIDGLTRIANYTLDNSIDVANFNSSGSYVLLRTKAGFASYSIDRSLLTKTALDKGLSSKLFWIDTTHLGMIVDGKLTMRDVDGTNAHELNDANDATATLSRNGTYMYSFGMTDDNHITLQRIRMILR